MTESFSQGNLPDDVSQWPTDPRELFGIGPEGTRRDLKRAYTRLIKRYKPEHAPDEFRRLREAFDSLDAQLEWREVIEARQNTDLGLSEDVIDLPTTSFSSVTSTANAIEHDAADGDTASDGTRRSSQCNETDQIWQIALDGGDLSSSYRNLVEEVARRPMSAVTYARLYWLLTMHPEFDSRDPIQWLLDGMKVQGIDSNLLLMLSIDVRRRHGVVPAMIEAWPFDLDCATGPLVQLMAIRWCVARRLSRFDLISDDLSRLRDRFLDERDAWQRLLLEAVRQLMLIRSETAFKLIDAVDQELTATSAGIDANWFWDTYEACVSVHSIWRNGADGIKNEDLSLFHFIDLQGRSTATTNTAPHQTRDRLEALLTLTEATWDCPPMHCRPELIQFCEDLLVHPTIGLRDLAVIAQVARPLIRHLFELIREQLAEIPDSDRLEVTPAAQQALTRFVTADLWVHDRWHLTVLDFCLKEAFTPDEIGEALEKQIGDEVDSRLYLAEALKSHLPLACLVAAQRLVWAPP